jgi:hypothetical protein
MSACPGSSSHLARDRDRSRRTTSVGLRASARRRMHEPSSTTWRCRAVAVVGWRAAVRARAPAVCAELGVPDRADTVADIIGAAAGTRGVRTGAGRLLAARAAGHEYDPERIARFDELATYLRAIPPDADAPVELPAIAGGRLRPGQERTTPNLPVSRARPPDRWNPAQIWPEASRVSPLR